MRPNGYTAVLVRRGTALYVCERCGAVTADPPAHDLWHEVVGALLDRPGARIEETHGVALVVDLDGEAAE